MLVIRADLRRDIGVREDRQFAARLGDHGGTLDILVVAEANVDRRVAHGLEELGTGMFVEHTLTKRAKLLPFKPSVLNVIRSSNANKSKQPTTNCLF